MSTPAASAFARSLASLRGYCSKSDASPNWRGLTKIDITTVALSARARSTSETCPACSQPMVGTRPTGRGASASAARRSARVRTTRKEALEVAIERDAGERYARGPVVGAAAQDLVEDGLVHAHGLGL